MILDRGKSGSWGHFVSHAKQILPILICKMFWHASFGLQPLQLFFTCIVCLLFLWLQQNLIQAVSNNSWLLSLTTGNNKGLTLALQSFIITACWREISVNIPQLFQYEPAIISMCQNIVNTVESLPINIGTSRQKQRYT